MMLTERTTVPTEALPIANSRTTCAWGPGSPTTCCRHDVLEGCLRAAIAAVEARPASPCYPQLYLVGYGLAGPSRNTLPGRPSWRSTRWRSSTASARRRSSTRALCPRAGRPPAAHRGDVAVPALDPDRGQRARSSSTRAMRQTWDELPADLARAVLLLAAHYYDQRSEGGDRAGRSPMASQPCSTATATSGCSGGRHDGRAADPQAGARRAAEGARTGPAASPKSGLRSASSGPTSGPGREGRERRRASSPFRRCPTGSR